MKNNYPFKLRAILLKPMVAHVANAMHDRFGIRTQASEPPYILVPVTSGQIQHLGLRRSGTSNVFVK